MNVTIAPTALELILMFARPSFNEHRETGGVLLGKRDDAGYTILSASGPGEIPDRSEFAFEIDIRYASGFVHGAQIHTQGFLE